MNYKQYNDNKNNVSNKKEMFHFQHGSIYVRFAGENGNPDYYVFFGKKIQYSKKEIKEMKRGNYPAGNFEHDVEQEMYESGLSW